ncbi:MAG: hypothetical protein ACLFP8_03420 [Alphaproteobacteria bacterium]
MFYVFAISGFIAGFMAGQGFLFFLLRGVSKEDMLNDKYLHLKYGLLNWIVAGAGCYCAILLYQRYY